MQAFRRRSGWYTPRPRRSRNTQFQSKLGGYFVVATCRPGAFTCSRSLAEASWRTISVGGWARALFGVGFGSHRTCVPAWFGAHQLAHDVRANIIDSYAHRVRSSFRDPTSIDRHSHSAAASSSRVHRLSARAEPKRDRIARPAIHWSVRGPVPRRGGGISVRRHGSARGNRRRARAKQADENSERKSQYRR